MCTFGWTVVIVVLLSGALGAEGSGASLGSLPIIRRGMPNGFSNAGWKYDRYEDLPSLDAHTSMVVADLKGPGIIRHIHTTRHQNPELMARGIVLEITFDDAAEPAVRSPLADFFGDGCNGKSAYFSTPLIECAPWSYNCYLPMPFRKHARVVLRNDTDEDAMNYSYVEWEPLSGWDPDLGYFHATYARNAFQLTKDTDLMLFEVEGTGHLIGRQLSIVTEEPLFRDFAFVMEGNNEVDIDGRARAIDYLGTEDSFTFSWGFQAPFLGLRAGIPFVSKGDTNLLSIYRFHDHSPIRFDRSLQWHISWQHERFFTANPAWPAAVEAGGCWVDYATVFYWYQDSPEAYPHQPLPPVGERGYDRPVDVAALVSRLPVDEELANTFATEEDAKRVAIAGTFPGTHPFWIDQPGTTGGHPGNPNPGRSGILAVHPKSAKSPAYIVRRVTVPAAGQPKLRIVVSGDPYESPGRGDFLVAAGVLDGEEVSWLGEEVISAGATPDEGNWRVLEYDLSPLAGRTVGLIVRQSYGGPDGMFNEEAFFDEISVVTEG